MFCWYHSVNPSSTSTRRADARRNVRNEHDRHTVEWISSLTKRNWKYLAPLAVLLCVGAIVGGIFGSKAATKKEGLTSTNGYRSFLSKPTFYRSIE